MRRVDKQSHAPREPSDEPALTKAKPVVRLPRRGLSGAAMAGGAAVAAILLFSALEAHRKTPIEPSIRPSAADASLVRADPPPLFIPPAPPPAPSPSPVQLAAAVLPPQPSPRMQPQYAPPPPPPAPPQYYPPPPPPSPPPSQPTRNVAGSALVIDATVSSAPATSGAPGAPGIASGLNGGSGGRTRSSMLANRSATVPQGTVIPAVLETAFDSTRPGFARAIVSRNVQGFDGAKVLIPRGSRLVGEYRSDAKAGENRAVITWTRLVRPDGTIIAIDSPAVDPLGRGGVRASVNSHVPERVFGALLQSTFQLGSVLATRAATGSIIVALPGNMQNSFTPQASPAAIAPTLKVPAGTSISIFVAHDLEFSLEDHP